MKELKINYRTLALIKWLWGKAKSYRLQAGINAFLGCSSVLLDFAFIWATKMAIDIATQKQGGTLETAAAFLIGIVLSQILAGFIGRWVKAILGVHAQNKMQQHIFKHLLDGNWSSLEKRHTGDMLNRLERDVLDVVSMITETLPNMLAVCVRLIGGFMFLYSMDSFLACSVIIILPFFLLLSKVYVRKMRSITREIRNTDSCIQSILQETLQHKMVIKTLEQSGTMAERLDSVQGNLRKQVKHRTVYSSFSGTMLNIGFASCYLIAFLWGSNRLLEGTITYGMMMAFIQLVGQIQGPFREMTRFIPLFISSLTATERLMELEEIPQEEQGSSIRLKGNIGIRLNKVHFAYEDGHREIFSDFSFDFQPGCSTAIMGETGAGKTTLIRMILGLIQPTRGTIEFYNHQETVSCGPRTRCNIVYVPQGNTLFSGTVRENLLLGNPQADEKQMNEALRIACADFIFDLPDGINTKCHEMGGGFSEGQAQRIAIARALLRDGSILLLDEATSALDLDTEKQLLINLQQKLHEKTLLFITHRPAVLAHCNQTLKLSRNHQIEVHTMPSGGHPVQQTTV